MWPPEENREDHREENVHCYKTSQRRKQARCCNDLIGLLCCFLKMGKPGSVLLQPLQNVFEICCWLVKFWQFLLQLTCHNTTHIFVIQNQSSLLFCKHDLIRFQETHEVILAKTFGSIQVRSDKKKHLVVKGCREFTMQHGCLLFH